MAGIKTSIQIIDKFSSPMKKLASKLAATNDAVNKLSGGLEKTNFSAPLNKLTSSFNGVTGSAYKLNSATTHFSNKLDTFKVKTDEVQKAQQKLNATHTASVTKTRQVAQSTKVATQANTRLGNSSGGASGKQKKLNNELSRGSMLADHLKTKINTLIGAYGGIMAVSGIIQTNDALTNMRARLGLIEGDAKKLVALQDEIFRASVRSQSSYLSTANLVGRIGMNAKDAFRNTQEMVGFAELLNKKFIIAGSTTEEMESAIIQLTQALGSGVLRGEELAAVFEAAPNIIQDIADYLDVPMGKIRKLAEEGLLSTKIVKEAIFSNVAKTNQQFEKMPLTFARVWTMFKSYATKSFEAINQKLETILNSKAFLNMFAILANGVRNVLIAVDKTMGFIGDTFKFLYDNMSFVAPVLWGIGAALLFQGSAAIFSRVKTLASMVATGYAAVANWALTASIIAMTIAQGNFALALAMTPVSWVIGLVIGLVVALYLGVAAFNKIADTSISATGIIAGSVSWLVAQVWNTIATGVNSIMWAFQTVSNFSITIAEVVYNAFMGGFTGWIDVFKSAFWNTIQWAMDAVKPVVEALDYVAGTDYASKFNVRPDLLESGKTDDYKKFDRNELYDKYRLDWVDPNAEYKKGYEWGSDLSDKFDPKKAIDKFVNTDEMIKDFQGKIVPSGSSLADFLGTTKDKNFKGEPLSKADKDKIEKLLGNIDKNTKKDGMDEELKYLREIGERDQINRFTSSQIRVEAKPIFNGAKPEDSTNFIEKLIQEIRNSLYMSAEGVHN